MSEWLKEHAWKACVGETLPRVRIPLSPPISLASLAHWRVEGSSGWQRRAAHVASGTESSLSAAGYPAGSVATSPFRIAQPYGADVGRESTTLSEHATVADAFAEIDHLAATMARTGAPSDAITLVVLDAAGRVYTGPWLTSSGDATAAEARWTGAVPCR